MAGNILRDTAPPETERMRGESVPDVKLTSFEQATVDKFDSQEDLKDFTSNEMAALKRAGIKLEKDFFPDE